MFKRVQQLSFRRFAHGYGVSPLLKEQAYASSKFDAKAGEAFKKAYEEKVHHSESITNAWKKAVYFIAFPAILLTAIPVAKIELEHAEHRKHLAHLSDEEWPTQYEYQNLRQKKFFWGDGDKTLFWNSDINRHIES